MKQVLFIQGGAGVDDHDADGRLVDSLKKILGDGYTIHYPLLQEEPAPDFGRLKQIEDELSRIAGEVILIGHSLGASMILKFLSERNVSRKLAGIFLIATPYWKGDDEWKKGLKLKPDFAKRLPVNVPIFLYHGHDDEDVPITHLQFYIDNLPNATARKTKGDHQLNNNLAVVAEDIMSLG